MVQKMCTTEEEIRTEILWMDTNGSKTNLGNPPEETTDLHQKGRSFGGEIAVN